MTGVPAICALGDPKVQPNLQHGLICCRGELDKIVRTTYSSTLTLLHCSTAIHICFYILTTQTVLHQVLEH